MRGEHAGYRDVAINPTGSSPHARGAHLPQRRHDRRDGIIPACAGSTWRRSSSSARRRDHPRMRGEHARRCAWCVLYTGSSPHARGALGDLGHGGRDAGIIPACAGSTKLRHRAERGREDHPRMRGEHAMEDGEISAEEGSSPHARGARDGGGERQRDEGIIPACAGSTSDGARGDDVERDHPRMRGEHYDFDERGDPRPGSSPHARGARGLLQLDRQGNGIIPACAGST